MALRCLLLDRDAAVGATEELRAKVRSALGVEVYTLAQDEGIRPRHQPAVSRCCAYPAFEHAPRCWIA